MHLWEDDRVIITDTTGLLVTVAVMAVSQQGRDGAKTALLSAYRATPIRHIFADQGFAERDPKVAAALIRWAAIAGMTRRITRGWRCRRQARGCGISRLVDSYVFDRDRMLPEALRIPFV